MLDFGNKLFIFLEIKLINTPFTYGQDLAITRICDAIVKGGIPAIYVKAYHNVRDCSMQVYVADLEVYKVYYTNGEWYPGDGITVIDFIKQCLETHGLNEYIKT